MQLCPKEVYYLLSHEGTCDICDVGLPITVSGDAAQSDNMVETSNERIQLCDPGSIYQPRR
jgi:hypothetical protein